MRPALFQGSLFPDSGPAPELRRGPDGEILVSDEELRSMSREELLGVARQGYFVRDLPLDVVYCPAGAELHRKSVKKNGCVRYCHKHACRVCAMRCTASPYKEVDFTANVLIKGIGRDRKKPGGVNCFSAEG